MNIKMSWVCRRQVVYWSLLWVLYSVIEVKHHTGVVLWELVMQVRALPSFVLA